jgi:selenocysteine lyase/cysteine desulfurase
VIRSHCAVSGSAAHRGSPQPQQSGCIALHDACLLRAVRIQGRQGDLPPAGTILVVDGAQSYPHLPIDVEELGCDFFVWSSHKALGPSGVGVVYAASRWLDELSPPWLGGGTLDKYSLTDGHSLRPVPHRFELGTPNIEGVIAAAAAARFLDPLHQAMEPQSGAESSQQRARVSP